MSKLQITDLSNQDAESFLTDLSESEREQITGAGLWCLVKAVVSFIFC